METAIPTIDEAKLNDFGTRLFALWGTHVSDRKAVEEKWMKNLRQFRGIHDPEILALIDKDKSKAFPRMTRWKVIGTVARLMQMLWAGTEKNYGVDASALPDLSTDQLQTVLDTLVASKGGDPAAVTLEDEEIEKAILAFAKGKAERMAVKIEDDLQEMQFIPIARKVVFSATLYDVGVAKGPMHNAATVRTWQKNANTGRYEAVTRETYKPVFEFLRIWDYYPDLTAQSIDKQDGEFERHVMTRVQVEELAKRPDFIAERVNKWLRENPTGNYTPQWWESVMKGEPKSDRQYTAVESRKYEVLSYEGTVSGHELRAAGVDIADADLGKSLQASSWMIGNTVIKAKLAPLGGIPFYHKFVFEDDDLSLLGNGQCDTLRDSQLSINEVVRSVLDNNSVCGPMAVINLDTLAPGQDPKLRKNKSWFVEGLNGNQNIDAAIKNLTIDSHLQDSIALLNVFMEFADKESGLPPPSLGDVSGGGSEALRTQRNASMFLGAAALPIRDTVRNYDLFTVSYISALVAWNAKFDPNPSRDGDHNIIARGSTSLIAKEVLSQALEAFRAGITEDERPHINVRNLLEQRAKANDIPTDELLVSKDEAAATIKATQDAHQAQTELQKELINAQVQDVLAAAFKKVAEAHKADGKMGIEVFQAVVDALHQGQQLDNDTARVANEAVKTVSDHALGAAQVEVDHKKVAKMGAKSGAK
jgi:hypothetical protein